MTDYYVSYGVVALLSVLGVAFVGGTFLLWRLLRPSNPTREKLLVYECGIDAVGQTWTQPNVRYYVFAFLFAIFDVESVFLFPWAVVYERLGLFAVVEMILFIAILGFGLIYAWRRRVLEWT